VCTSNPVSIISDTQGVDYDLVVIGGGSGGLACSKEGMVSKEFSLFRLKVTIIVCSRGKMIRIGIHLCMYVCMYVWR